MRATVPLKKTDFSKDYQRAPGTKKIVVMPAYNAAKTLEKTLDDLPAGYVDEIILVDDCSTDNTVEVAKNLGLVVLEHEKNGGYGANQKTCYDEALKREADIVIMLHPDYQYDSRLVPYMVGFIEKGICDIILGSRIRTRAETLACGMPLYKYISNRFLTIIENMVLGQNIGDLCVIRQKAFIWGWLVFFHQNIKSSGSFFCQNHPYSHRVWRYSHTPGTPLPRSPSQAPLSSSPPGTTASY